MKRMTAGSTGRAHFGKLKTVLENIKDIQQAGIIRTASLTPLLPDPPVITAGCTKV